MKLTKETLKQIIKEELEATMEEGFFDNVFGRDPNKIGKGPKATDLKSIRDYGQEVAENRQPMLNKKALRSLAEFFCDVNKCSVDLRDVEVAFEEGYKDGKNKPPEKRQYDGDVQDYERHDYDKRYRRAMSDAGVGVGALSMPSDRKKPVS